MSKYKICCIFNIGAHYRAPIYELMDRHLNCDFYLGDKIHTPLKKMDYTKLKGFKKELAYKKIFGNFYWQRGAVINVFKPYKDYLLVGEPYCLSTWVILFLTKFTKKKTYLWSHGWYGNERKLKSRIKIMFFKMSSGVFLYGNYAKDLMIKEGFNENSLHVIYNSLDYNNQKKIRKGLHKTDIFFNRFKNQNPVLTFTGRLNKVKKLELLIQAHKILDERGQKLNVLILGDGPEKEFLEELVRENCLSNKYWFYGACYDEKIIGELFYNSIACVSPGNIGLSAIHSLTYGTPAITHNNFSNQMPEFEAIIDGKTGSFFEENDVRDLSKEISCWMNKSLSRDETRKNYFKIVDDFYNPFYQIKILKEVIKN